MTVLYSDFIAAFPEFSDPQPYPENQIDFWISQGYEQLNARRFGVAMDLAVMLFAAHNVVMSAREMKAANSGQIVGDVTGQITGKAIGKVSVSYGVTTGIDGAGAWNYTMYGQRLYNMMRAYGAGPQYVHGHGRFGPQGGPR